MELLDEAERIGLPITQINRESHFIESAQTKTTGKVRKIKKINFMYDWSQLDIKTGYKKDSSGVREGDTGCGQKLPVNKRQETERQREMREK